MPSNSPPPDFVISIKRTVVPIVVGWLIAQLVRVGVDIDATLLAPIFNELVITLYYVVVRFAESRWPGAVSLLLGSREQPEYNQPPLTPEKSPSLDI